MNITNNHRNELLKRREMSVEIEHSSNPGYVEAQKIIADTAKTSEENIKIKKITSKFGRNTFIIDANVYDSADKKQEIEPKPKVKKEKKK